MSPTPDSTTQPRRSYTRRQHPRTFCSRCDDYPAGFRGEYELQRHINRKHMPTRKVWITVDISKAENAAPSSVTGGISTLDLPRRPLADCKTCLSGKEYSVPYNAAAHLRRVHFNPRASRRAGQPTDELWRRGVNDKVSPSMEMLKSWMKDIGVVNRDVVQQPAQGQPIACDVMESNELPQDT